MNKNEHLWVSEKDNNYAGSMTAYGRLHQMRCKKCNNHLDIGEEEMIGTVALTLYNQDSTWGVKCKFIHELNSKIKPCEISDEEYKMRELLK